MFEFLWVVWGWIVQYSSLGGAIFGIAGALVIWKPTHSAKIIGFELWLYSNVFWMIVAWSIPNWGLLAMNLVYTISNLVGIVKHVPEANKERELLKIPPKTEP